MIIMGVDYHPEFQQIALSDKDSGEFQEERLGHPAEAEQFYRALAATGQKVRVGMEASGQARWFERLLAENYCRTDSDALGFEVLAQAARFERIWTRSFFFLFPGLLHLAGFPPTLRKRFINEPTATEPFTR